MFWYCKDNRFLVDIRYTGSPARMSDAWNVFGNLGVGGCAFYVIVQVF